MTDDERLTFGALDNIEFDGRTGGYLSWNDSRLDGLIQQVKAKRGYKWELTQAGRVECERLRAKAANDAIAGLTGGEVQHGE